MGTCSRYPSLNIIFDISFSVSVNFHLNVVLSRFYQRCIFNIYSYFQRRRRLRRFPVPNSQALSLLGRDLREAHLQVLLGGNASTHHRSNSSASSTAATDNLLSSLVLNFSASETDEISKSLISSLEDNSTKNVASQHVRKSRYLIRFGFLKTTYEHYTLVMFLRAPAVFTLRWVVKSVNKEWNRKLGELCLSRICSFLPYWPTSETY